ncbi:hypothetical protein DL89DRAFT_289508 [Linderina pennispora]|uniref:RRM domain-containing protein n=1 Tax=Linderina pennispora TaxID=61395 RepID=A0A1Y1WJZ1_9FUNG|nr:uncharacterized protein DL89DRAFT_289508 [Linderina pennispora]ORX73802.1 hypothetical protein DL89DRAFT_289508 [Linderina pennispora]
MLRQTLLQLHQLAGRRAFTQQTAMGLRMADRLQTPKPVLQQQRVYRQQDGLPTPNTYASLTVRVSNLPPTATAADVRSRLTSINFASKIRWVRFEYDYTLRALNSCRTQFAGSTVRADFVALDSVPNPTVSQYLGGAQGRLVFLSGLPQYSNVHSVRDVFKEYDLVDTSLPAVQQAPQMGKTFLTRKGAFIMQFATPAEARRFVRDVHLTEFRAKSDESETDATDDSKVQPAKYLMKALLIQ